MNLRKQAVIELGGRMANREKIDPHRQQLSKSMLNKFPYYFARQEASKLSDAPEQFTNKGKRLDGAAEKNEHAAHGGRSFPTTKSSVYAEMQEKAAKRDQDHIETNKMN